MGETIYQQGMFTEDGVDRDVCGMRIFETYEEIDDDVLETCLEYCFQLAKSKANEKYNNLVDQGATPNVAVVDIQWKDNQHYKGQIHRHRK